MKIMTASWRTEVPEGYVKIGILRGTPRWMPRGYRRYPSLQPSDWYREEPKDYLPKYDAKLAGLDSQQVRDDLFEMMKEKGGTVAVMVCYENPAKIAAGEDWCHRHLIAQWLEDRLGFEVEELGYPGLDRYPHFRRAGIATPSYRKIGATKNWGTP